MKDKSIWTRTVETTVCQIRNGWLLVPITVCLTITILRIGILACSLIALALVGVICGCKYRIVIHRKGSS